MALAMLMGCVCASTGAQGVTTLNRTGSGARAAGMANAFVAVSDDGTAASWNPAGLAQLRMPELSLVSSAVDRRFSMEGYRSLDGQFVYTPRRFAFTYASPEFASAAVPFTVAGKPITLQFGWRRLYQLAAKADVEYQKERAPGDGVPLLRLRQDLDSDGSVNILSLAGALRLTERLSAGASLDFWRGDWTDETVILEEHPGGATDFASIATSHRVRGHNLNGGLLFTYPRVKVGLVYHRPVDMSYRRGATIQSSVAPRVEADADDARFHFPRSWGAGVAWRPAARWTLAADVTHDRWSDFTVAGLPEHPEPANFFDGESPDRTSTRDTVSLNAGVERLLQGSGFVVPLRLGLAWEPQGFMDPLLRDPVDYVMLAAGTGYNTNSFKFDMAFQLRWTRNRSSETASVLSL
ncbi:MAG TPA: outer membrane protein transport protein, partial [Vicinamibacteria bacterium]